MGLFSAFKSKQTYTLYKDRTKANFQTTDFDSPIISLNYTRLGIFKNPYDGFGDSFERSFRRGSVEKLEVSSDLTDLMQTANKFNSIEKGFIKSELLNVFGRFFKLDDLAERCDHPDYTMFDDFENLIYEQNQNK